MKPHRRVALLLQQDKASYRRNSPNEWCRCCSFPKSNLPKHLWCLMGPVWVPEIHKRGRYMLCPPREGGTDGCVSVPKNTHILQLYKIFEIVNWGDQKMGQRKMKWETKWEEKLGMKPGFGERTKCLRSSQKWQGVLGWEGIASALLELGTLNFLVSLGRS